MPPARSLPKASDELAGPRCKRGRGWPTPAQKPPMPPCPRRDRQTRHDPARPSHCRAPQSRNHRLSDPTTHRAVRPRRTCPLAMRPRRGARRLAGVGYRPNRVTSATRTSTIDPRRSHHPGKPRLGRTRQRAPTTTENQHCPTAPRQTTHTRTRHRNRHRLSLNGLWTSQSLSQRNERPR